VVRGETGKIAQGVACCERCPLYIDATQAVVGEGPAPAAIMLVGEQPGDQEDRAGRPFVGPAGRSRLEGKRSRPEQPMRSRPIIP
jgi:uracil-DNA glycosylase